MLQFLMSRENLNINKVKKNRYQMLILIQSLYASSEFI